ncbi:hypothetical protein [Thermogymnomonas acidicola]|uniref:hypothetical protein n=1 Tax=Thermogymnomonas acidicola TaxID=399579 RepID=UPI00139691AC|nr:hypothetical protein [Thermogymnomonas acidicola]
MTDQARERSVQSMVSEVVENDIFLANALKRGGYANLSQVARMIRPIVRDRLNSEVTEQAILSALKRKRASLPRAENRIMNVLAHSNLSLYGGVVKVVLGTESASRYSETSSRGTRYTTYT